MRSFERKLGKALESLSVQHTVSDILEAAIAEPTEPIIIDMNSMEQRKNALHSCRGPHFGWNEYASGVEYQPPYYFNSNVPLGPQADPNKNQFASKAGNVRPWTRSEIIETLASPGGLAYSIIAKDPFLRMYTKDLHDKGAISSLLNLAAEVIERKIFQDQSRTGVRFTSWLYKWLFTGMRRGISAGYGNEYRIARGLLKYWDSVASSATTAARQTEEGQRPDMSRFVNAVMEGGETKGRSGPVKRYGLSTMSPEKGPKNQFGDFADRIYDLGHSLVKAIQSGDPTAINGSRNDLRKFKDELTEEENTRRSRGAHFDKLMAPGVKVDSMFTKGENDADIERSDVATDSSSSERAHRMDTMKRLVSMSRKGLHVDFMMAKGMVSQVLGMLNSPPDISEFNIEEVGSDSGRPSYNIMSPNGYAVATFDTPDEAKRALSSMNPQQALMRDIDSLADHIGQQYGQYGRELKSAMDDLSAALSQNDRAVLDDVTDELETIGKLADQDAAKASAGKQGASARAHLKPIVQPLSEVEYRVLLRYLGASDYAERGTKEDPEIIDGKLSDWAAAGYPALNKADIARSMGFSKVRASQVFKKAMDKVRNISHAAFGDTGVKFESYEHKPMLLEECQFAIATCLTEFFSELGPVSRMLLLD